MNLFESVALCSCKTLNQFTLPDVERYSSLLRLAARKCNSGALTFNHDFLSPSEIIFEDSLP